MMAPKRPVHIALATLVVALLTVTGCGSGGQNIATPEGQVLIDGTTKCYPGAYMKLWEQMFPEEANVVTDLLEYPKKERLVDSPIFGVTSDNGFNYVEVPGLGDDAR